MVWEDSDATDLGPAAPLPPGCVADGLVSHFWVASSTVLVIVEVPSFSVLHSAPPSTSAAFTCHFYSCWVLGWLQFGSAMRSRTVRVLCKPRGPHAHALWPLPRSGIVTRRACVCGHVVDSTKRRPERWYPSCSRLFLRLTCCTWLCQGYSLGRSSAPTDIQCGFNASFPGY